MTTTRRRDSLMATWGPRPTDVPRTAAFLRALQALPGWHPLHLQPGRPQDLRPLALSDADVARLLEDAVDHDDFGAPMPGTGSSLDVWNGVDGPQSRAAHLRLGASDPHLGNVVSVKVPVEPPPGTGDEAELVLRLVVEAWRPEHAWSGPAALVLAQPGTSGADAVGRLTYLPRRDPLPPLPADASVTPLADGVLLSLHASGEALTAQAAQLRQTLHDAGLL